MALPLAVLLTALGACVAMAPAASPAVPSAALSAAVAWFHDQGAGGIPAVR